MTTMPDKCPRCGADGCKTFEMNGRYIEAIEFVMRQRDALRQTLSELADLVVQYNKIDPSDREFPDLFIHMTRVAKSAQRLVEAMATVEVSDNA